MSVIYIETPRSCLFFNQYQYCARLHIPHVNLIRSCDINKMYNIMEYRSRLGLWRWHPYDAKPTADCIESLAQLVDPLLQLRDRVKLVFYTHCLFVYTNDCAMISQLQTLPAVVASEVIEARVSLEPNTIFLRKARFQLRSYFRAGWVEDSQRQTLLKFMTKRDQQYCLNRSLVTRLQMPKRFYMPDKCFVEHNSMQDLMMLSLTFPHQIKRTVTVKTK